MKHGKIDTKYYSTDLQKLIDLLLIKNYKERPNIDKVYNEIISIKERYINDEINLNKILSQKKYYKNEIRMIMFIGINDVNKDIYFLDNYFYDDDKKDYIHNGLKELNETNVE